MKAKDGVGGPVLIFREVNRAAKVSFSRLIYLIGVVSASLAIFNLFPIIPLDGGHLFLLAIEKIKGGPLPEKVEEYIAKTGLSLIILLALYIFYVDFEREGLFRWLQDMGNNFINLFKR